MPQSVAFRAPPGGTLARYLLTQMVQPFSATLLIVLPALLLERLLRLFDLIATRSVAGGAILRMLVDLIPHYMGLALPAALFAGVYVVVARLGAGNELDAMQNAGFSLRWIARPFIAFGMVAALAGFGLYGYAQPYARYAYRAAFQAAADGAWDATIPPGEITRVSRDLVVTADTSDRASGRLGGVAIYRHRSDGSEDLTTARTGQLTLSPDGGEVLLTLQDAVQLVTQADGRNGALTSPSTTQLRPFVLHLAAFRARGADEREMTLGEIWAARQTPHPAMPLRKLDGELHSRLVRALSLALLPVLAVPFGLAAKRTRRPFGIVVGVILLVLYLHAVQLAQSAGTAGFADPRPLLWGLFVAFAATCVGMFRRAEAHTAEGPLDGVFQAMEEIVTLYLGRWRALRAAVGVRAA